MRQCRIFSFQNSHGKAMLLIVGSRQSQQMNRRRDRPMSCSPSLSVIPCRRLSERREATIRCHVKAKRDKKLILSLSFTRKNNDCIPSNYRQRQGNPSG